MPTIDNTPNGSTVILRILDEEDWNLNEVVEAQLDSGRRQFVLDLDGQDFLNSVKIAAIIQAFHQIDTAEGCLRLANLEPRMRQIFQVLKLERLFALDENLETALAAFAC